MAARAKLYNLNLSPSYVPKWGAWEVAREVICNAMDADAVGLKLEEVSEHCVRVTTTTVPDIAQLFIIGQGTKTIGGNTIGQFGEGVKMAALAATRLANEKRERGVRYAGLTLHLPDRTITFEFKSSLGVETLHARVVEAENSEGFTAEIHIPNIVQSYEGKLLVGDDAHEFGPRKKLAADKLRIYVKGVFIADVQEDSLYDWNLKDVEVNRDRDTVSSFNLQLAIGKFYAYNSAKLDGATVISADKPTVEAKGLAWYKSDPDVKRVMLEAFEQKHGTDAVLALNEKSDIAAMAKGKMMVHVTDFVRDVLQEAGVRTTRDVVSESDDLEAVDASQYSEQIARLRQLDPIIKAPNVSIYVFAVRDEAMMGRADLKDYRLWLSEHLFAEGNEHELTRTYLHELGHFMSNAHDCTREFENALDGIAGRLALHVLGSGDACD